MFYNTRTRLEALKNTSEEYSRILDVVTRYAVHNPTVSFFVKKVMDYISLGPDGSDSFRRLAHQRRMFRLQELQRLRRSFGCFMVTLSQRSSYLRPSAARMVRAKMTRHGRLLSILQTPTIRPSGRHFCSLSIVRGHQRAYTHLKILIDRLVESSRIRRALEAIYQGILPKGACPWIYLDLEIDPRSVDVNVHPTKSQVHFLNEEEITQKVADKMQEMLAKESQSRTFEYQTVLTPTLGIKERNTDKEELPEGDAGRPMELQTGKAPKVYSHLKVRTSLKDRTLDSMFPLADASQVPKAGPSSAVASSESGKSGEIKESRCFLASVKTLRQRIAKGKHRRKFLPFAILWRDPDVLVRALGSFGKAYICWCS